MPFLSFPHNSRRRSSSDASGVHVGQRHDPRVKRAGRSAVGRRLLVNVNLRYLEAIVRRASGRWETAFRLNAKDDDDVDED